MNVLTYIPSDVRKWIYVVYAAVGILLGAAAAGFGVVTSTLPVWLVVSQVVYGYLGTATGIIAASNVNPSEEDDEVGEL